MAKAIVFLWDGHNIDDSTVKKMANVLIDSGACIPELLKAKAYDDADIAAIVRSYVKSKHVTFGNEATSINETIKNAIVYMEKSFPTMRTSQIGFVVDLAYTLQNNPSKELYAAIHIIANAPANNHHLVKLQKANLDVIRNMYARYKSIIDNYVS